jgi:Ca2+-binding RTX toxin-like protein
MSVPSSRWRLFADLWVWIKSRCSFRSAGNRFSNNNGRRTKRRSHPRRRASRGLFSGGPMQLAKLRRLEFEQCEPRQLLTVTSTIETIASDQVLHIRGDSDANTIAPTIVNSGTALQVSVGNSFLLADFAQVLVDAGAGNDVITMPSGLTKPVSINGDADNDTLTGGGGDNTLAGGSGDDTYHPVVAGGSGTVSIVESASNGTDTLDFSNSSAGVSVNLRSTTAQSLGSSSLLLSDPAGIENVIGSSGNDTLIGNGLGNSLSGGVGNDVLYGEDPNLTSNVVGRHLFYNQSGTSTRYDHNDLAINSFDDNAIATDKTAYLWEDNGAATFANVSSYTKGINGIMVDITGSHPSITAADFIFLVGNNSTPSSWSTANAPTSVSVRAGAGVGGSDRVEIIWNGAAAPIKQWLQVITLDNANTGLSQPDAFFFGNAVADSGAGDTVSFALVTAVDEEGARNNPQLPSANIPITNLYDYNRNAGVSAIDESAAQLNGTNPATALRFINLAAPPAPPNDTLFGGDGNDIFNVNSTSAGASITLDGGAGVNTFYVGDDTSSTVSKLAGTVTVVASSGTNTLIVQAGADTSNASFTVASSGITAANFAVNTSGSLTSVTLRTRTTSAISVPSTSAATTSVYTTSDVRTVTVSPAGLGGDFGVISDGTSINSLVIDGSTNTLSSVTTVQGSDADHLKNTISGLGSAYNVTTARYAQGSFQSVQINGPNSPSNSYTISSPTVALTINAGSGSDNFNVNSTLASVPVTLNGGAGKNTFNVNNLQATAPLTLNGGHDVDRFNLNSSLNGGTVTLNGGAGDDVYRFFGIAGINATILDEEGTNDQLNFATLSYTSGVFLDLGNSNPQTIATNGTKSIVLNVSQPLSGIERVIGTTFNDNITGDSGDNLLDGNLGSDTLNGGPGNDTFLFSGTPSVRTVTIGDAAPGAGGGLNTLDFSGLAYLDFPVVAYASGVNVDLRITGLQTVVTDVNLGNALTLNLNGAALIISGVKGTPANDTIIGDDGNNVLNGIGGIDTLEGGAGNDTYAFSGAAAATITIIDLPAGSGGGINTLDFSGLTTTNYPSYGSGVTVDIGNSATVQTVADHGGSTKLYLDLSQANLAIANVIGSPVADRITGNSLDNVLEGGDGNDTLSGESGNDTYVAVDGNGNRDTIIDSPRADGLFPSTSPVFAGSPVTFTLEAPSPSAHFSFADTEGALATTYNGIGAGASSTSASFTFTSGSNTMWGRVIDSNDVSSTFETQFTVATGFGIGGRVRNAADQNPTTAFDLTLFSTNDVPSSQWVIQWGDGTSSTYTVSPTSASPIVRSHAYPSQTGIYQVTGTVTDTNNNATELAPVTVEIWGTTPFAPQNVKAEQITVDNSSTNHWANISWDAPFGPTTGFLVEYALNEDGSDGWKVFRSGSVPGDNFAFQGVLEKDFFRVTFSNANVPSETSEIVSPIYVAQDNAVTISAAAQSSSTPQITLSWPLWAINAAPFTTGYTVDRRVQGASTWQTITTLPLAAMSTGFVDPNVELGTIYEYHVTRQQNGSDDAAIGSGYVVAGVEIPLNQSPRKVILVVDDRFTNTLAAELAQLQEDLAGDGWTVIRHDVSPSATVVSVKNLIKFDYDADPNNVKQVFLIGHVPVPYSGYLDPDGHPDHQGAYPADAFYGDMDGNWTDNTDFPISGAKAHSNIHNDTFYDQNVLSGPLVPELAVGRVDMYGMVPVNGQSDSSSELAMLARYFERNHAFRQSQLTVEKRALVDHNFVGSFTAVGAYQEFGGLVGDSNVHGAYWFNPDLPNSGTDEGGSLWGYADGGGEFTKMSYVGDSDDFLNEDHPDHGPSTVVFNILYGSYFGDWNSDRLSGSNDNSRSLLRAPLAGPGNGLTTVWGNPSYTAGVKWSFQNMGVGATIGESIVFSQHRGLDAANDMGVEAALMGDPTLRQDMVAPPTAVTATQNGSNIDVAWTASPDGSVLGYNVYRGTSLNSLVKINGTRVNGISFTDPGAGPGPYIYMVRAVKLESGYSGSYYNASQGAFHYMLTASVNSPLAVPETNSSTTIVFTVTLSMSFGQALTVAYHTAPSTSMNPAAALADYTAASGVLTFAANDPSETFTINIVGDTLDEENEDFLVVLSDPLGSDLLGLDVSIGVGTITDDDA